MKKRRRREKNQKPAACRPACRGSASGEFILPAVPDAARTAVVDRRQLTGKMKSPALEKNTIGTASPRRTKVLTLAKASSVILGRCENAVTTPNHIRSFAIKKVRRRRKVRRLPAQICADAGAENGALLPAPHTRFAWFYAPHRRPRPPPGPPVRPPPTVPTPRPRSPKTGRRELAIPSFPRNHTTYWLPLPISRFSRWISFGRVG